MIKQGDVLIAKRDLIISQQDADGLHLGEFHELSSYAIEAIDSDKLLLSDEHNSPIWLKTEYVLHRFTLKQPEL